MVPVNLAAGQQLIPMKLYESLPEIVKKEIQTVKLNGSEYESMMERTVTTNRIISMLDVKFNGETEDEKDRDKDLAKSEFATFLKSYRMTGSEVIEAYRMALTGELNYKVYPTLSIIQCGEILEMYNSFKVNSPFRKNGLDVIKNYFESQKEKQVEDQEEIDLKFRMRVYEEIKKDGFSENLHFLYEPLMRAGKLRIWSKNDKRRFFLYVKKKMTAQMKAEAVIGNQFSAYRQTLMKDEKMMNAYVRSRCREIFVCNYLKKHCETFEQFTEALNIGRGD